MGDPGAAIEVRAVDGVCARFDRSVATHLARKSWAFGPWSTVVHDVRRSSTSRTGIRRFTIPTTVSRVLPGDPDLVDGSRVRADTTLRNVNQFAVTLIDSRHKMDVSTDKTAAQG